jgi:hypothetical protein
VDRGPSGLGRKMSLIDKCEGARRRESGGICLHRGTNFQYPKNRDEDETEKDDQTTGQQMELLGGKAKIGPRSKYTRGVKAGKQAALGGEMS